MRKELSRLAMGELEGWTPGIAVGGKFDILCPYGCKPGGDPRKDWGPMPRYNTTDDCKRVLFTFMATEIGEIVELVWKLQGVDLTEDSLTKSVAVIGASPEVWQRAILTYVGKWQDDETEMRRPLNCPPSSEKEAQALDFVSQPGNGAEAHLLAEEFNALPARKKWDTWEKQKGKWYCVHCGTELGDGPRRADPFPRVQVCCGECDGELTRRTGGGQSDPFNWVLRP